MHKAKSIKKYHRNTTEIRQNQLILFYIFLFYNMFLHFLVYYFPISNHCSTDVKTSKLTCLANQLTGFNRKGTLVINWLRSHPFSKYAKFSEKQTFLYEDGRTYKHKFIGPILLGVKKKKRIRRF